MEMFIPGFAALLIVSLIVFLVLPRMGAPLLAVLALVMLYFGVKNHMTQFGSEYRFSTWQELLKDYAAFFLVGFLILAVLGYIAFLFGMGGGASLPASNVPAITGVLNATKSSGNTGILGAATNGINNAMSSITGTAPNRSNTLANLGKMVATPMNSLGLGNGRNNKGILG